MDKWLEIAGKNGTVALVLLAFAWFFYKKIWPVIEKRLADADNERKENLQRWEDQGKMFTDALKQQRTADDKRWEEQSKLFGEALRTQNVMAAETHRESVKATNEVAQEVRTLTHFLKNGTGK